MPETKIKRRSFITGIAVMAGFTLISKEELIKMLKPITIEEILGRETPPYSEEYLAEKAREEENRIKEMYREELERIAREKGTESPEYKLAKKIYDSIKVKYTTPRPGARYAYALDVNKCIGCRRCVYACVMENNTAKNLKIEWIQVLECERENIEIVESERDYDIAPKKDRVYVPIACMHCSNPPCVMACPVKATWREADNIVVVDYERCIGCRYCAVACPYGARHFNWTKPEVPLTMLNPNMHYLGNVVREAHVIEKCTWCIQRVRDGGAPACVEHCPVGARIFGDLNDPKSPVRLVIEKYGAFVLKPEAGTKPNFFYFFGPVRSPPVEEGGGEEHA